MISPDSDADETSSKYNVQIGEGKYIVIGDQAHVEYHLAPEAEPKVDLAAAEALYRQKVVDAYKWLNFSGFARSDLSLTNVPLEEVFVRLSLTVEKIIREPVPAEQAGQTGRGKSWQRERVIVVQEPIELGQALSNHLLLVGEPGAGKSMLLRWLAVTFAEARQQEPNRVGPSADADRLPVLVELGRLPDRYVKPEGGEAPNWIQFLPEYLTTQMAFTNTPPQLLTRALADGRCLLMFDGLDEVADRQVRTRLARSLVELARLSPGNRMIIGSRPAGVSESEGALRPQFQRCQIERFKPEDLQRFFRFWYALDRGLTSEQQRNAADALYARVQATPATLQLATTPLLSTILVLIWRNEGGLPERRVDLYERCCRILIEHWEVSHDVAYQGTLVGMDWEDHLRLLTPLAYAIHSQEQRTSATREELVPLLAQALQTAGSANEQAAATREAKHFLDALSLRSGLLQYLGNDRYGFPHQTFQEYLAARYIATQPDPEHIDLVMAHLHEAWWQEVHLLTIAYLGSGSMEASKASALILAILHVYRPPSWILRSSRNLWLRLPTRFALIILGISIIALFKGLTPAFINLLCIAAAAGLIQLLLIGLGKLLLQVQLERRIAWILAREFELAARGYAECVPNGTTAKVATAISAQAASLVQNIWAFREEQTLLTAIYQWLQPQKNKAVVNALQKALRNDTDSDVRRRAAESLGRLGVSNQAVVSALLEALRNDTDLDVRRRAAESLGLMGAGNEAVNALLEALHSAGWYVRRRAVESLGLMGAGNEAVNALLEALHSADSAVRSRAAESLGRLGVSNQAVVSTLQKALRNDTDLDVRRRAAESLGLMGVSNQAVVSALLEALHDADRDVRSIAAGSLGSLEIKDTIQLREVLVALNRHLFNVDDSRRRVVLVSIRHLLDGRPISGYRWVPLRKR